MSTKISGYASATPALADTLPLVTAAGTNRKCLVSDALNALPQAKFTSINVTVGTLAAGTITGAAFVSLMSTNATPGNQTTRTAAQMIADHGMGAITVSYLLRITNTGAGTLTLLAGANVTLTGTMTVLQNTFRDFVVTLDGGGGTATIQSIGTGTYS